MQKEERTLAIIQSPLPIIGWREYIALPKLGIPEIKVKIDTGARSSALHAFDIETFQGNGKIMVRFKVYPYQRDNHRTVFAEAEVIDHREVRNSGGYAQLRPVIQTNVKLGEFAFPIELTLTNRGNMNFRMLLGRQAIRRRFLVDAGRSFLQSRIGSNRHQQADKKLL